MDPQSAIGKMHFAEKGIDTEESHRRILVAPVRMRVVRGPTSWSFSAAASAMKLNKALMIVMIVIIVIATGILR